MDGLIAKYADELQKIYDNRTASDHTFTGVLSTFLTAAFVLEAKRIQQEEEDIAWNEHRRRMADEASEDDYDAYMNDTQEGEILL